jgi:NAD(P)-dependent dehydrogenase (short-subunit alcohol dehydrogenase family)
VSGSTLQPSQGAATVPRPPEVAGVTERSVDLQGQVAIVTGAGQGIGRACALHLARCGARVLVNSRLSAGQNPAQGRAAGVVAQIVAAGGEALVNTLDVAEHDAGQRLVDQAMAAWGRVDMVHANAALGQHSSFAATPMAQLRAIMDVGFGATMALFHAVWPVMKAQGGGRLLATSSSAGRFGGHGLSAYGASKGAVEALVRSLAAEGSRLGIRCNALSPYAHTQMTGEHLLAAWAAALPAEAIAPVATWLLSPGCSLNGEVVVSGGGRHARAWSVETAAVSGDLASGAWSRLASAPGRPQPGAMPAFVAFMEGVS